MDEILKMLWDNKVIHVFKDNRNIEYYALISDFYLGLIFPKYLLNVIKREYDQKSKSDLVLLEYLTVLENTYTAYKAATESKE